MNIKSFKFRPGTIDETVYKSVVDLNEYRVPNELPGCDLVIDIGAHIGSFSHLCWNHGARTIEAFEPDSENFQCAQNNLAGTSVVVKQLAVWRSDRRDPTLHHSGYTEMLLDGPDPVGINTGGGNVFSSTGQKIEVVSLDDVIGDRRVSILKLDCEGSEFPILLTSRKLKNIRTIVGEYHIMKEIPSVAQVEGFVTYSAGTLLDLLSRLRFKVEIVPHPDRRFSSFVGSFFASNMDWE